MTDISVEVSGEMDAPMVTPKSKLPSFLQLPTQMPDPKEWISQQRQKVRPWLIFIMTSNFKIPVSVPRLGKRIMRNIEYFQANYLFVFLGLVVYCLVTSPLILLVIAGTFYVGYRLNKRQQEKPLVLFGKELTLAQQYVIVTLCSLPIFFMVGAHGAIFWVLGASMVVITLHAAFYNIEALVTREDDSYALLEEV
ncbi:prenylated Rab acceptor protein 1 [Diabrotica virgifera virgifera]|uniref:PRA1 family protein n=1 Tax=Diabrotica virgifera virgifera TaxID=50390 RepID=A0A6P7G4D1_DIAVI|nr:prenylated Rab acceptor protein 1 [Diabrotica virgifera virgifera]